MTSPADAITVLNRIHAADPTVLPALIGYRVPANGALVDDPTVQVGEPTPGEYRLGFLGVLNGIFGIRPDGQGYIGARFDGTGRLLRFEAS